MYLKIREVLLFWVMLMGVSLAKDAKITTVEMQTGPDFVGYATDRIIITFDQTILQKIDKSIFHLGRTGDFGLDLLNTQFKASSVSQLFKGSKVKTINGTTFNLSNIYKIKFNERIDPLQVVQAYSQLAGILKAEPVGIHQVNTIPNDSQFGRQWHLNRILNDADVDAPEAWEIETGDKDVIVAVMDTGVRYFHSDLGGANASFASATNVDGNMWVNWTEKNGSAGVDDDKNGFIDDWIGWDFVDNGTLVHPSEDGNTQDNDPRDFNGHGTHCAGNISAMNNNGGGLCAVTGGWGNGNRQVSGNGVKVMALRIGYQNILGQGLVAMDAAAEALYYAADNGAKIASCSWGSSSSGGMDAAADYFIANGGLVFHAAGNDGSDSPDYLDNRGDCISVAATDTNDTAADFTNYGDWVDISAPGTIIWSTYHVYDDEENDYIAGVSGTSMSTPIAASVAALIWSKYPSWTAAQVKQRLYDTADNIEDKLPQNLKGKMGTGRVNAFNAVNEEATGTIGDVNSDESSNSTDALIILSCDVGLDVSSFCPMNCGDVNDDGFINSTDALIIRSYDVGLEITFPVGQSGCFEGVTSCAGCNP